MMAGDRRGMTITTPAPVSASGRRGYRAGVVYGRSDPAPPEPRAQGRPPKGEDDAGRLAEVYASLYLREWKAAPVDLRVLYGSPQLQTARERYFAGLPDATDRAILLLRRWFALYCGERAVRNALALGRGGDLRLARVAARILVHRLHHPDLTRAEEAAAIGRELGLPLDASAHRRAVDAMFACARRYGPDLLRDLAWKTPERWQLYEARYGVEPASDMC